MTLKAKDYLKEVGVPYWRAFICSLQKTKLIAQLPAHAKISKITMILKVKLYLLGSIKLQTKFWKQETIPETNWLTDVSY